MNEQVNTTLRNILNSWAQGLLTQEETINRIKEEAGYGKVAISGRGSYSDRTNVQTVQPTEDDGEG
jgi:hypothetical protein